MRVIDPTLQCPECEHRMTCPETYMPGAPECKKHLKQYQDVK
jgi:primosomal protein N'